MNRKTHDALFANLLLLCYTTESGQRRLNAGCNYSRVPVSIRLSNTPQLLKLKRGLTDQDHEKPEVAT